MVDILSKAQISHRFPHTDWMHHICYVIKNTYTGGQPDMVGVIIKVRMTYVRFRCELFYQILAVDIKEIFVFEKLTQLGRTRFEPWLT